MICSFEKYRIDEAATAAQLTAAPAVMAATHSVLAATAARVVQDATLTAAQEVMVKAEMEAQRRAVQAVMVIFQ